MTIKCIYFWGMCAARFARNYTYNGRQLLDFLTEYLMPVCSNNVESIKSYLRYYNSTTSFEEMIRQREEHWVKFKQEFLPGDTRLFITVPEQEAQLEADMKQQELNKYLVYKSQLAVNRNYPENGPRLRLWIYHIPEEQ